MGLIVLYTTHPDKECAEGMTKLLLNKRLVACGNIYPMTSYYWWKGEIENGEEWVAIYKTSPDHLQQIEEIFQTEHPYEVPCIVRWDAAANLPYEAWVVAETSS